MAINNFGKKRVGRVMKYFGLIGMGFAIKNKTKLIWYGQLLFLLFRTGTKISIAFTDWAINFAKNARTFAIFV